MSSRLRSLYSFLKESGLLSEAFSLKKIIKTSQQTTVDMEGVEIKLDSYNPFDIRASKEVVSVTWQGGNHSIKATPIYLPDGSKTYIVDRWEDAASYFGDYGSFETAFGGIGDAFRAIESIDFNAKNFEEEIARLEKENFNYVDYLTGDYQDYGKDRASMKRALEDYYNTDECEVYSPEDLSDSFDDFYRDYILNQMSYDDKRREAFGNLKIDIVGNNRRAGFLWFDKENDVVYYGKRSFSWENKDYKVKVYVNPPEELSKLDKYVFKHQERIRKYRENPEEGYRDILRWSSLHMDGHSVDGLFVHLGCKYFLSATSLVDGNIPIVVEEKGWPSHGKHTLGEDSAKVGGKYVVILKKDKVTNQPFKAFVDNNDGCDIMELHQAQKGLKKRDGEIPKYTPPAREIEDDTPNPLSFPSYKKRTEDSNYWGLPDPEYPDINPGDSWENICKIYPNHPKCKNNKSNFSYNPSDEFEPGSREYKSPFGGGYITEESIMNSDIAKEYVEKVLGGISNIKNTTSIGGVKMYHLPSENVMSKAISLGGSKL